MTSSQAVLPHLIEKTENRAIANLAAVVFGIAFISLLAQIAIPLPWTPVPITGQTFGVTMMALLWGRNRAIFTMIGYLGLGALGLPVFAQGGSSLSIGPTFGYLVGMFFSSMVVGELADLGWTKTFLKSFGAAVIGSVFVFGFGLLILSMFIPTSTLLVAGVLPFLLGDVIKNLLAAATVTGLRKKAHL